MLNLESLTLAITEMLAKTSDKPIFWTNWLYHYIRSPSVSYLMYNFVELWLQKMGDFYEKAFYYEKF